jgi:CubicO group peptidase (beta-lactamase class C family)
MVWVLLTGLLCTSIIYAQPDGGTASPGGESADEVYRFVENYLEQQLKRFNIPGAALAIVEGDQIVRFRGFGTDRPGGITPSPETPFVIGSLTKSFTALAIMQLVEEGRVELDAPVRRYLSWFTLADPAVAEEITVRHLLNQTSGLSQVYGMRPLTNFDDSPGVCERQARSLASFLPTRRPGEAYEYSNMNFNLLGLIIEAVSGETYGEYVEQNIFEPLGMVHSHTSQAGAKRDGLAVGQRLIFGFPRAKPELPLPVGSLPSGQLISSVADMGRYLVANLNGGRYKERSIISPSGMTELHRPAVPAGVMGIDMGHYTMGWFVEDNEYGRLIWHDGTLPDYFSYMALLPEQSRGMVLLVNGNQMMVNFALLDVCMKAAGILAGGTLNGTGMNDDGASESGSAGIFWILRGLFLIPILQLVSVNLTLRRIRRWRHEPGRRPNRMKRWVYHILLAALPHLVLMVLVVVLAATRMARFMLLFAPDITWLLIGCGCFAFVWVIVRTGLIMSVPNEYRSIPNLSQADSA